MSSPHRRGGLAAVAHAGRSARDHGRFPREVGLGRRAARGLVFVAAMVAGCAAPRLEPPVPPSLAGWRAALSELEGLRAEATGDGPRTFKLSVALREPITGRRTEARGAVALSPADRAVRMILVGPGGTTAFDLWIRADQFRVSIPAVDVLRRGDASTPKEQMRGLPVDFLRWWLLDPTRGDLLWADRTAESARYVLREGSAVTELVVAADRSVRAQRRTWTREGSEPGEAGELVLLDEERVNADHIGCGRARYTQASTGVEIEIACEGVEPSPPSERAFVDPDAAEEEEEQP